MLSLIYQIHREFSRRHGIQPNILYLNPQHLQLLEREYPVNSDREQIFALLGMVLVVDRDVVHPHLAWSSVAERRVS